MVIAIIAVLAALLFPVFSAARGKAYSTQCLSNLRQIGLAIELYTSDYDERYPYGVDSADRNCPEIWELFPEWQALIPSMAYYHRDPGPYVKNSEVWHCPRTQVRHPGRRGITAEGSSNCLPGLREQLPLPDRTGLLRGYGCTDARPHHRECSV